MATELVCSKVSVSAFHAVDPGRACRRVRAARSSRVGSHPGGPPRSRTGSVGPSAGADDTTYGCNPQPCRSCTSWMGRPGRRDRRRRVFRRYTAVERYQFAVHA